MREIRPIGTPDAVVSVPGSKSITNRGLAIGALAEGETVLHGALLSEDTVRLAAALRELGFFVREEPEKELFRITGEGGRIPAHRAELDVGSSGTALRFLTAMAALGPGEYVIDGEAGLRRRPMEPLCHALRLLGADARAAEHGGAPVLVRAGELTGGKVEVAGEVSSQFASALLLIGPHLPYALRLCVPGKLVSSPFLELTASMMEDFGALIRKEGPRRYRVEPAACKGREYRVEGDASSASYFFAAAAVTGGRVRVRNLPRESRQGDLVMLDILESMGSTVTRGPDWAEVRGGRLRGIDVNLAGAPDLVPTVAAVGMVAAGRTRIRGVPHLRVKETDRIETILRAVKALGGRARALADGISVEGSTLRAGAVDPLNDHRIAMAFSVLGLKRPGIRILMPECVGKSFPDFFARLSKLG